MSFSIIPDILSAFLTTAELEDDDPAHALILAPAHAADPAPLGSKNIYIHKITKF